MARKRETTSRPCVSIMVAVDVGVDRRCDVRMACDSYIALDWTTVVVCALSRLIE